MTGRSFVGRQTHPFHPGQGLLVIAVGVSRGQADRNKPSFAALHNMREADPVSVATTCC
jgi:hypothetical protein